MLKKKKKFLDFLLLDGLEMSSTQPFSMVFWLYFRSVLYVYSSILELSQINQTTLQNKIICDICSL